MRRVCKTVRVCASGERPIGCVATGASLKHVEREMRTAIALHLEGIVEDDGEIPGPGVYVEHKSHGAA